MDWPATADELKAAGYSGLRYGKCSCGVVVVWARTPSGKKMPMERIADPDQDRWQSHFADCPHADRHRRG